MRLIFMLIVALLSACNNSPEATPLNVDHPIVISGCDISYKAKPLRLGAGIESWVEVLGPYDRKVELANDVYVWDQIGLNVLSYPGRSKVEEMAIIFGIEKSIIDQVDLIKDPALAESMKKSISARPKTMYKNHFLIDGVPFDQKFDLGDINAERFYMNEHQAFFHKTYVNFRFQFERNCGEKELAYIVHTFTNDTSRVTNFAVGFTN